MKLSFLIAATLGLFLGICFAYNINFSSQIFIVSLVLSIINFFIFKFYKNKLLKNGNSISIFFIFLFLFVSLGILLGQNSIYNTSLQKKNFNNFISQKNVFTGYVFKIKDTENSKQLFLKIKDIQSENNYIIKVITSNLFKYQVGDVLSVEGKISKKEILLPSVEKNTNLSFDIARQNSFKKIDGEIVFGKINFLGKKRSVIYQIKNLRSNFVDILDKMSPRVVTALSAGTTFGDGSFFNKSDINNFRLAGISHIIVLSGFNITILVLFFSFLFLKVNLKLYWRVVLNIFCICIFIIFVGGEASIIRAGIMSSVFLISSIFGRQYFAKQGLFLAVFFMMVFNPVIAVFDVSFHLSFLATFGILYFIPILNKYAFFKKYERKNYFLKSILQIFKTTLAAQIFVTPYIMFIFGKVSIFSIIVNILVLPFVPIIMFLCLLIIIFYFLYSPISIMFGYISFIFCKYIFLISEYFAKISPKDNYSYISIFNMIIIYILILFFFYFEKERLKVKKYLENK